MTIKTIRSKIMSNIYRKHIELCSLVKHLLTYCYFPISIKPPAAENNK